MKYFLLLLMFCSRCYSGEIHWVTNDGIYSSIQCDIVAQSHSDSVNVSEYWVDCKDNNVSATNDNGVIGNSIVYFGGINGGVGLICTMITSIFGTSGNDFYMLLDCKNNNFANGFELN